MIEIFKPLDKAIMIGILIWGGTTNRTILSADRQSLETRVSVKTDLGKMISFILRIT